VLGPIPLVSSMAVIWVADIAAYFAGRALGRHKLAPAISPGKTWEGAIGGFVAVVTIGLLCARLPGLGESFPALLVDRLTMGGATLALVAIAALSIVGDLHESLLKREAGVKDSGTLLPGHGGVLDRIDALIPTMPAALLLYQLLR
jgi:phosphatidate cytidylyltransferase